MKKLNLHVSGMTCTSCEVLIERKLKQVPGVEKVTVNRAKEQAIVECSGDINLQQLQEAVKEKGYTLSVNNSADPIEHPPKNSFINKNRERLSEIGSVLVIIIGAYILLRQLDLLPKGLGITENMGYGFVFLIGLVAATSTCLAVAGGLLLAVAGKYNEKYPHLTGWQKFQPHVYFNVGRIASYTVLGGVIGLLGSVLTISPSVTGMITIGASILMIVMGIQLLQIFPWANKIQLKMPKFIAHKIYDASSQEKVSKGKSFLFGAATFFLPCGFTQALQLYILGKGDFLTGALTMLAFSLGTLPSLAGIGAFSSFSKGNLQRHFMTFSAVLVIILGLFNIPNGLALTGAVIGVGNDVIQDQLENVKIVDDKQIVEMSVDYLDYYPQQFTILQGIPVEWRIDGRKAEGCAQVISVPSLGITEYLSRDQVKVITFTPEEVGQIRFSCTMGMAGPGMFNVIPNTRELKAASVNVAPESKGIDVSGDVQKITMEISQEKGFYPNAHVVKAGIPVKMEIDTKIRLGGCMGTMVIPEYGVAHLLEIGKTTIEFTPTKKGTVPFTCSMGSKMGEFIVV